MALGFNDLQTGRQNNFKQLLYGTIIGFFFISSSFFIKEEFSIHLILRSFRGIVQK